MPRILLDTLARRQAANAVYPWLTEIAPKPYGPLEIDFIHDLPHDRRKIVDKARFIYRLSRDSTLERIELCDIYDMPIKSIMEYAAIITVDTNEKLTVFIVDSINAHVHDATYDDAIDYVSLAMDGMSSQMKKILTKD